MSRYRLLPTPAQEAVLRDHCAHARYVWNLAVEQHAHWHPGRKSPPGYLEQCRQLTQARAEHAWLAAGSQMVQQQALRDFAGAMAAFFDPHNPAHRPSWRKAGRDEGFRIVGQRGRQWDVRRLSRHVAEVRVPKAGWVRFRWSRAVPKGVKSYRVARDRAGRWHIAFTAIPELVPAPGNDQVVGVDRGVAVAAALSTGELLRVPGLTAPERKRLRRLEHKLTRAERGSGRRKRVKAALARLRARETDRRKDWAEKTSTGIARRFDAIRVEDLKIANMTRSAAGTGENPGRNVGAKAALNLSRGGVGGVHHVHNDLFNSCDVQCFPVCVSGVIHVRSPACHSCLARCGWSRVSRSSWSSARTSIRMPKLVPISSGCSTGRAGLPGPPGRTALASRHT
jgi:putative transposase